MADGGGDAGADLFGDTSSESDFEGFDEEDLVQPERHLRDVNNLGMDDVSDVSDVDSEVSLSDESDHSDEDLGFTDAADDFSPDVAPFAKYVGSCIHGINLESPVNYFQIFFPDEVINIFVTETNKFARQGNVSEAVFHDTTLEEMRAYIAMNITMGIHRLPSYQFYWGEDDHLNVPGISKVMPRLQYEKLNCFFHIADNTVAPP